MKLSDVLAILIAAIGLNYILNQTKAAPPPPPPPSITPVTITYSFGNPGVIVVIFKNTGPIALSLVGWAVARNSLNQDVLALSQNFQLAPNGDSLQRSFDFTSLAPGIYTVRLFAVTTSGAVASLTTTFSYIFAGRPQGPGDGGPPPPTTYPTISQALIRSVGFGAPPIGSLYAVDSISGPILGLPPGLYKVVA